MNFAVISALFAATNAYTCSWQIDTILKGSAAASACVVTGGTTTAGVQWKYNTVPIGSCSSVVPVKYAAGTNAPSTTADTAV
jgi:hypothetical protein